MGPVLLVVPLWLSRRFVCSCALLWKVKNSSLCRQVDIGTREIVGYGANGEVTYIDSVMAPFPAIRSTTEFKQYQS